MKAILLSVKPENVVKILNGEKTIEIRKCFPVDYVGWVYIYCTKGKLNLIYEQDYNEENQTWEKPKYYLVDYGDKYSLNGKVVARFWCDKVDEYINGGNWTRYEKDRKYNGVIDFSDYLNDNVLGKSCLTEDELFSYCDDLAFSAIHITKLEIFDKPKELSKFRKYYRSKGYPQNQSWYLTKAPQNMVYIKEK